MVTARRFLTARQWDMPKATQLLHDYLGWKKQFGCPVDPKSCLGELIKGKTFMRGRDRDGNALLYHFVRQQDPGERDLQEAVRAAIFWAEQAEKEDASTTGKITLVFVRAGATAANGDLTLARAIAPLLSNNFPERLDKVLVYPTGPGFRAAWMACQLFLDQATRKKVVPINEQYELLTYIASEHLLAEFGGLDQFQFTPQAIPGVNWWDLESHQAKALASRQAQQAAALAEQQRQQAMRSPLGAGPAGYGAQQQQYQQQGYPPPQGPSRGGFPGYGQQQQQQPPPPPGGYPGFGQQRGGPPPPQQQQRGGLFGGLFQRSPQPPQQQGPPRGAWGGPAQGPPPARGPGGYPPHGYGPPPQGPQGGFGFSAPQGPPAQQHPPGYGYPPPGYRPPQGHAQQQQNQNQQQNQQPWQGQPQSQQQGSQQAKVQQQEEPTQEPPPPHHHQQQQQQPPPSGWQ